MAYKTIQRRVSVPDLELCGPMTEELWAKEVRESCTMLYGKMGWWVFFCPPTWLSQYKCMDIFFKLFKTVVTLAFIGISA